MLNRRELSAPELPESAKPNFFDYELRFMDVQNTLENSRKIGKHYFLICLVLLIKPLILLQFSRFNSLSSLVYIITLSGLFGEVFVASRNWHHKSILSWFWLPMISMLTSLLILCTGDFITSLFAFIFTVVEFLVILPLVRFSDLTMPSQHEFFTDKLWQDAEKLGNKKDCEKYAYFRAEKSEELIKKKIMESKFFKCWSALFAYFLVIIAEVILIYSRFMIAEMIVLILILSVVISTFLILQIVNAKFYPTFLFFIGMLAAINIYQLFNTSFWFLVILDIAAIIFVLALIYRYFHDLYFIRAINFNYFDLISLLESENPDVAQKSFGILKKNTGLDLPFSKDHWLDKLVEAQNVDHKI